jgi:carboxy-cis,cis-muconate cyclase
MAPYHFLVGTMNSPHVYTFSFTPPSSPGKLASLKVAHKSDTVGSHSWLHLQTIRNKRILYATAWTEPPSLVAYAIHSPTDIRYINSVETAARSGYVCASDRAVYSAGGAVGEVFAIDASTGGFALSYSSSNQRQKPLQEVDFVGSSEKQENNGSVMDFGGLRHGAHSADLSPNGKALYVADIGRNCIWDFPVDPKTGMLGEQKKYEAPREGDGPRHTHPHPNGRHLYCVQEHSSMVDVYKVADDSVSLEHVQGVKIIPKGEDHKLYWADEVRTSLSDGDRPKYLYASTRGLEIDRKNTEKYRKGWVCAFKLREDGTIDERAGKDENGSLHMWETPSSGGWSNAIQPGPTVDGVEYIALTDSEAWQVIVLGWDGKRFEEVARAKMDEGAVVATAVWL